MGTMTLPKWIRPLVYFMMQLMYDIGSRLFSFVVSSEY